MFSAEGGINNCQANKEENLESKFIGKTLFLITA
jgi:hypothetical protein